MSGRWSIWRYLQVKIFMFCENKNDITANVAKIQPNLCLWCSHNWLGIFIIFINHLGLAVSSNVCQWWWWQVSVLTMPCWWRYRGPFVTVVSSSCYFFAAVNFIIRMSCLVSNRKFIIKSSQQFRKISVKRFLASLILTTNQSCSHSILVLFISFLFIL